MDPFFGTLQRVPKNVFSGFLKRRQLTSVKVGRTPVTSIERFTIRLSRADWGRRSMNPLFARDWKERPTGQQSLV